MEKFVDKKWFRTDVYDIVDQFPEGYIVWNIGRQNFNHPEYIPLALPDPEQEFHVLTKGLKALKVESEELAKFIMDKAIKGVHDPNKTWFDEIVKKFKIIN